jgi:hypothetical protein
LPCLRAALILPSFYYCSLPHVSIFFAAARCTCERGRALSHTFVQAAFAYLAFSFVPALLTPRRFPSSGFHARASRPMRRRPRRSLHRAARPGSSPQDHTAARIHAHTSPCSPSPDPPMTHPLRRASRSATGAPMPMPWSNPFRTGKLLFFPPRCTSKSSAPSAVATSPHPRGPRFWCIIRLQHFCVEADTTTAAEDPIRLH